MIGDPPFALPDITVLAPPAFAGLIAMEMIAARISGQGGYDARDTAANVAMWLGAILAKALTGVVAFNAFWWAFNLRLFDVPWAWWSLPLCFLGEDLAFYWFHRISHERRWLWASHVVHHSSQHFNLSTALRQTWTSAISGTFVFWLPLLFVGFPPAMVFFFSACSLVYQFWIHTERIGSLGPLEWVFNTPAHHRLHHAANREYLDANYGGVLIVWDRLFGTFTAADPRIAPRYGLTTNLATFNPLVVAFHEWAAMAADVVRAKSLREALFHLFGPPGRQLALSRGRRRDAKIQAA